MNLSSIRREQKFLRKIKVEKFVGMLTYCKISTGNQWIFHNIEKPETMEIFKPQADEY